MARKLANWIDSWYEFTAPLPSPELWRKWTGISVIAAAMERRLWIKTGLGVLYPNLYTVLVGPPGTGKTLLTSRVNAILKDVGVGTGRDLHVAPSSVTGASIIDELVDSETKFLHIQSGSYVDYNSLTLVSNELGVLLPEYDIPLMNKLTDIYDAFPYSERRRGNNLNVKVERPSLNILAATTPSFLNSVLPEGAWEQGFMSRTLLAYSGEKLSREVFTEIQTESALYTALVQDLRAIFEDYGAIVFQPEAIAGIESWVKAGAPPVPEHPKLIHYNTRRVAHMLKLCMCASLSRGGDHIVTVDDYNMALGWLLELETLLPDIFKSMATGGDMRAVDECWFFVLQMTSREGKPLHEGRIVHFLMERLPAHSVSRVLEVMISAGILIQEPSTVPGKFYRAKLRKPGT